MGSQDQSGFNAGKVTELRAEINSTAQQVASEVVDELEKGVIKKIAKAWYAEEAQEYFQGFAQVVADSGVKVREIFEQFRQNVEKTGTEWATATNSADVPTLAPLDDITLKLDTSSIQAKDGAGNRYLDESDVASVIGSLESVYGNIKSKMGRLAKKLDADTAFLGHKQGDAVKDCFVRVAEAVHEIFMYILVGDDALSGALEKYKTKYAESAENVAKSFSQAKVEITKG